MPDSAIRDIAPVSIVAPIDGRGLVTPPNRIELFHWGDMRRPELERMARAAIAVRAYFGHSVQQL